MTPADLRSLRWLRAHLLEYPADPQAKAAISTLDRLIDFVRREESRERRTLS